MKTFKHIALAFTALLLVTSCAIDEMWEGMDTQDEEKVLTFKPKFEDFEAVTKAIGDGSKVDKLLVQVYDGNEVVYSEEYDKGEWSEIAIPFYYGKTYQVYFWAYAKEKNAYTIADEGLKNGVTVNYPASTDALGFDALEYLDAFYAIETINLSDNIPDNTNPSLTRPFAQVNLVAVKAELETAKATKVEFAINAADSFVPGAENAVSTKERIFTFKNEGFFQENEVVSEGKVYLGTTYLFAPSSGSLEAKVTLYDSMENKLKGPTTVNITLATNQRTNLVFTGVEPAWDDDAMDVPDVDTSDGWIHIETAEQLAAFLIGGTTAETKVHICNGINMGGVPTKYYSAIAAASFSDLTLYGGTLENGNPVGGGSTMISDLNAPAFLGTATNLTLGNLNFDNCNVTYNGDSETHVGVLVNTLKGSSSFTNVIVSNSSATTSNGAAGGIVGYIERIAPTTRSEVMEVAFDNCKVNGAADKPVATGSLAEGKFVGLLSGYDNGETLTFDDKCSAGNNTTVADYASRYVEGNESAWQSGNDYSAYSGFLGDEKYLRAKVYFGGEDEAANRFCPKWDGTTNTTNLDIEPLLANATYDAGTTAGTNKFVVYSPFDLAGVRNKTASPAAIYLKSDVDMNGQGSDGKFNVPSNFTQSANASADDNNFNPFNYVTTLDGKKSDTENYSIYNMAISQIEQERAAFILYASGTTAHKNINFRNCQTVAVHKTVETDAKAYGAILVSNVDATYTMENVHAYDCKVFALQKVGTLGARISGTSILKNNSVNNCYVENYECKISERFSSGEKTIGSWTVTVYADFYPYGEVGGMYGFIQGSSTLTGCKVNGTTVYAFGQDDKMATTSGSLAARLGIALLGYYKVPGRHVSTLIGNIRATGTVTLTGCTVDANTKCTKRYDKHNSTYLYIGQAYIVKFVDSEGSVTVDGKKLTLADCNKNTKL